MDAVARFRWTLTVDEYLAFEERADARHEYVGGEVHAKVGASERHQLIALNIASTLRDAARKFDCRVILGDVKLQASADTIYYPDIMVICDPVDDDPYIKQRPLLLTEVLSPSTAAIDRREKMLAYRRLPSLLCYLVVHQAERRVENHWRETVEAPWGLEMVVDGPVAVPGLDVRITFAEIYEGINVNDSGD